MFEQLTTADIFVKLLIATALGGLIGLERQRGRRKDKSTFAGIRTFPLIAFFGGLTTLIAEQWNLPWLLPIAFLGFLGMIVSAYTTSALKGYFGITSELTAIIMFLMGVLCTNGEYIKYAIIFTVLLSILLTFKSTLHQFAQNTKRVEWNDTLKFALLALVILPMLPNQTFGPFDVFNPFQVWLIVVFVSGISFIGYFLVKLLGAKRGIVLTGLLGGLVSSTAVTNSMATRSRRAKISNVNPLVVAILAANAAMYIRVLLQVWVVSWEVGSELLIPLFLLTAATVFSALIFLQLGQGRGEDIKIKLESPFTLKPALIFAVTFVAILFTSKVAESYFGEAGVLLTSAITGFVNTNALSLSLAGLASSGSITAETATLAILIAIGTNSISKMVIVWLGGEKGLKIKFLLSLIGTSLTLTAGIILTRII